MRVRRYCHGGLATVVLFALLWRGTGELEAQEVILPQHRLAVEYSTARFDGDIDPWHVASIEGIRRSERGTFLLRGTLAKRFGDTGEQFEVEAYPRLGGRSYAYLAAGLSPSGLFPNRRFGGELFLSAADATEVSAGIRHLDFDDRNVTLLTASLGHYFGPYFVNLRPYVSPRDGDFLYSGSLLLRRYSADPDEWVGLVVYGGEVPGEEATTFELERLKSAAASLEIRRQVTPRVGLRGSGGFEWEEIQPEVSRRRITLGVGIEARL